MQYTEELFIEQWELEKEQKTLAEAMKEKAFADQKSEGLASGIPVASSLINYRMKEVLQSVEEFVSHTTKPRRGVKPAYTYILQALVNIYEGKEDHLHALLAYLPFSVLIDNAMKSEFRLSNLSYSVGSQLQEEARLEAFCQKHPDEAQSTLKGMKSRIEAQYKSYYAKRRMDYSEFVWSSWATDDLKHLGAKLIEIVVEASGYFETYNGVSFKGSAMLEIRPTQWLLDTWDTNEGSLIGKAFRMVPTIIPPKPWEDLRTGAYYGELAQGVSLLRRHDLQAGSSVNAFSRDYMGRLAQLELKEVRQAINAIQETPWRINTQLLEVVEATLRNGGDIGGLPRLEPLPQLPRLPEGTPEEILKEHKAKAVKQIKLESRRKSQALRCVGTVKIAQKFSKYDRIYFPHNMDFRGRVYPIPSFNPQGDDLTKALIELVDTPPIASPEDIDWMMIHGANLAGVDKVSYEERKQWIRDNEERILAVAKEPLDDLWWSDMDAPFQFLAFCFEWLKLKEYEEKHGTPVGFITGLVVAFDGTCSGLQHFSAILRDPIGGQAVNLIPSEVPQDIYGLVAKKVNEQLERDAQTGTLDHMATNVKGTEFLQLGTKTLAQQWLIFGVDRKVTKRSVMTLAYGSREYGFRDQLMEDIIDPAILEGRGSMFTSSYQAGGYMAKLIWEAVQQVVVKAVEGMAWLQKMARLVTKEGRTVTWRTPMGLPVQQSYMENKFDIFRFRFGGKVKRVYTSKPTGNIDKKAQASGIAPNFIHSMDASHLQKTALDSYNQGIRHFAMIHDSYGTCVSQAGNLFRIVREAFVEMYETHDVFETFKEDMSIFIDQGTKIPKAPERGSLDLSVILESKYTFA